MKAKNTLFVGAGLLACVLTWSNRATALNDPHVPLGRGPWFEGWYTRITDVDGDRSLAVIVGSHLPTGQEYEPGGCLPGYIEILFSDGNGASVAVFEAFPECTYALVVGEPVDRSPGLHDGSNFEWVAEGYGSINQDEIDVELPGMARVWAQVSNRVSWSGTFGELGPEGLLAGLPLPMHWHVHSLGSTAQYEYEAFDEDAGGVLVQSRGYAHQEKNWGNAFPRAWMWVEGISANNESQLVLGGGRLAVGPVEFRPWIVGYHSPSLSWDFSFADLGTVIRTNVDACHGTFEMLARTPTRTLDVHAFAPLESFGSVGIPSMEGFVSDGAIESFSATIEVKAYEHTPWEGLFGRGELVEEQIFTNAVLEFGGDYRYCR